MLSSRAVSAPVTAVPLPFMPVDHVPLLDVERENKPLELKIAAAISQVTQSGRFVLGPECKQFEQRMAQLCGVKHALGCASGTDALLLALMATSIGPGDEVIVPSFTFFATASCVSRLGATPVFADIDPTTLNLDAASVRHCLTAKTKAIIPVHLFGRPADLGPLCEIARERGLSIVEDAAQAIGATYGGQQVGAIGDLGCFSFYPTKNLGGFGDGGLVTTQSDELANRIRLLRVHGMEPRYYHSLIGINSRLDTLQAAVLNVKLPHLQDWTESRQNHARNYFDLFQEYDLLGAVILPSMSDGHVWNQFTLRVPAGTRDELRQYLKQHGVGSEIYYPVALHQQECFQHIPTRTHLEETERATREVLSLPIFPMLRKAEQRTVVYWIAEFFAQAGLRRQSPHLKIFK